MLTTEDRERFAKWAQVMNRGFHGAEVEDDNMAHLIESIGDRRVVGVWDDAALDPQDPVATSSAWPVEMTVPGERVLESWAISTVTVAPTHRRRGIARNLLEAELRTAAGLGIPAAILTVSESTIYGRFGFAPVAWAAYPKIEAKRARWVGPTPAGRLDIIPKQRMRDEIQAFYDRVRLLSPGQIVVWPRRWDQIIGLIGDAGENRKRRVVRYSDADGVARGYAVYKLAENEEDNTKHILTVLYMLTETPDAASAIWRYLLEMDLVSEVHAHLRPIDDPMQWQIADWRSTQTVVEDHLWLRVLDVAATFEARDYLMAGQLGFEVSDDLGFTSGRWLLSVDETGCGVGVGCRGVPRGRAGRLALGQRALGAVSRWGLRGAAGGCRTLARAAPPVPRWRRMRSCVPRERPG